MAQLDAPSDWRTGGRGFKFPRRGQQHSSVEIDHEIYSMVILSLLPIQEGQLSPQYKQTLFTLVSTSYSFTLCSALGHITLVSISCSFTWGLALRRRPRTLFLLVSTSCSFAKPSALRRRARTFYTGEF